MQRVRSTDCVRLPCARSDNVATRIEIAQHDDPSQVVADTTMYKATINACEKRHEWQLASGLLSTITRANMMRTPSRKLQQSVRANACNLIGANARRPDLSKCVQTLSAQTQSCDTRPRGGLRRPRRRARLGRARVPQRRQPCLKGTRVADAAIGARGVSATRVATRVRLAQPDDQRMIW